jgi:hypothetical protein
VLENALDLEILDRGFGCLADDVLLGFQAPRGAERRSGLQIAVHEIDLL